MTASYQLSAGMLVLVVTVLSGGAQELDIRSARVHPPFAITNGWIYRAADATTTNCGRAEIKFNLKTAGRYCVSVQGKGISGHQQEVFIGIDKEPDRTRLLEFGLTNGVSGAVARFTKNTPRSFELTRGEHTLIIIGKTADTQFEKFTLIPQSSLGVLPSPPNKPRVSGVSP